MHNFVSFFVISSFIGLFNLNAVNLIPNSGFEEDNYSPLGKPDYYRYRTSEGTGPYHQIETNSSNVYEGSSCALFNNTSAENVDCYYYACYSADGSTLVPADVDSAEYELTVKYKTDSAFSGAGIRLQLFLYEDTEHIGLADTPYYTSSNSWSTLKLRVKVKGRVNKIFGSVCYSGKGKAWVDNMELEKVYPIKNASFEIDTAYPTDKPDYYRYRTSGGTGSYHHIENLFDYTYLGKSAAKFDNTSISNAACYYYGPYDDIGTTEQAIPVCPGDSYKLTGMARVDTLFSGSGVKFSLIFSNDSIYVSRSDSSNVSSSFWTKASVTGVVPAGADEMIYSVEYNGQNEAWADEIQLKQDNLVKNSCFETDNVNAIDIADYWRPRGATVLYHHVETDPNLVYEGSASALFNSPTTNACYFYGPANADGSSIEYIKVVSGETYDLSAWGKVDPNFSGNGIRLSLIFQDCDTYLSRIDSSYQTPSSWIQLNVQGTVPAGANRMYYSIEYKGLNKAWFDKVECYKSDSPWYYKEASATSFENLGFTAPSAVSFNDMVDEFYSHHNVFENNYAVYEEDGDPVLGTWGTGYEGVGHPLIRTTANAVLGYLYAGTKINNPVFAQRAEEGLEWLLSEQLVDGSFPWYNNIPPTIGDSNSMYVSGLAGTALIEGYRYFQDAAYLNASNDVCDYFLTIDPVYNVNFNAFAMRALLENYKETANSDYLDKALEFMDVMLVTQRDSGMWSDYHNQYIHYHSIITIGLALMVEVLPDSHPKKFVAKHALYKAFNNTRRRQYSNGIIEGHPFTVTPRYDPHTVIAFSIANSISGIDLSDSLDTLSYTAIAFSSSFGISNSYQGYNIAALGYLLALYY